MKTSCIAPQRFVLPENQANKFNFLLFQGKYQFPVWKKPLFSSLPKNNLQQ